MSDKIFCRDGKAITFYMIPNKRKQEISALVKGNGGRMVPVRKDADYQLYNPGDIVSDPKMVSCVFVEDCLKNNQLLDVEQYRYPVRWPIEKQQEQKTDNSHAIPDFVFEDDSDSRRSCRSQSVNPSGNALKRSEYSIREDMAIIDHVLLESKRHSVNGNKLWNILELKKITLRSSQSMKERFHKKILPYIDNYDIDEAKQKKLKLLTSAKTAYVIGDKGLNGKRSALPRLQTTEHETYEISDSSDSDIPLVKKEESRWLRTESRRSKMKPSTSKRLGDVMSDSTDYSGTEDFSEGDWFALRRKNNKKAKKDAPEKHSNDDHMSESSTPESRKDDSNGDTLKPTAIHVAEEGSSTVAKPSKPTVSPITLAEESDVTTTQVSQSWSSSSNEVLVQESPQNELFSGEILLQAASASETPISDVDANTNSLKVTPAVEIESEVGRTKPVEHPVNSTQNRPVTRTQNIPVTNTQNIPDTSTHNIPDTGTRNLLVAVVNSTQNRHDTSTQNRHDTSTQNRPDTSTQIYPVTSTQIYPVTSTQIPDSNEIFKTQIMSDSVCTTRQLDISSILPPQTHSQHSNHQPIDTRKTEWDKLMHSLQQKDSNFESGQSGSQTTSNSVWSSLDINTQQYATLSDQEKDANEKLLPRNENINKDVLHIRLDDRMKDGHGVVEDAHLSPQRSCTTSSIPPSPKCESRLQAVLLQPMKDDSMNESCYEDCKSNFGSDPSDTINSIPCGISSPRQYSRPVAKEPPVAHAKTSTSKDDGYSTIKVEHLPNAQQNKCEKCGKGRALCAFAALKSSQKYQMIMKKYRIDPDNMFAVTAGLSADWEVIEQHIMTKGQVGRIWTRKDDQKLTEQFNRKRNLKELRHYFSNREIKSRKIFLLGSTCLSAEQKRSLLNIHCDS